MRYPHVLAVSFILAWCVMMCPALMPSRRIHQLGKAGPPAVRLCFGGIITCLLMAVILQVFPTSGQSVLPTGATFSHVLMVESKFGRGSIFSIDVDNREYWITAKHVLTGRENPPYGSITDKTVTLKILDPDAKSMDWKDETFQVIDPGDDIDIVVLATNVPLLSGLNPLQASSQGATLGGDCDFLGFPYGGGWKAPFADGKTYWLPFVKHCNISAMSKEDKFIWILDGINNAGFSGGPVIIGSGSDQKVMAVVSGYVTEPAEVIASLQNASPPKDPGKPVKETAKVNSGFIIAFDIFYAIEAIHAHPIGPLRQSKQ